MFIYLLKDAKLASINLENKMTSTRTCQLCGKEIEKDFSKCECSLIFEGEVVEKWKTDLCEYCFTHGFRRKISS